MELLNINDIEEFRKLRVIKKIPIMTDQLIASILFIDYKTNIPAHSHKEMDEIQYVVKGSGKIVVGNRSRSIKEGMLILVSRAETHCFSTSKDRMIVLSIGLLNNRGEDGKIAG